MPALLIPVDGGPAFRLEKPIVLIGRHEDCDLSLPDQVKISRRHCCLARVNDRFVVRDLGSMNGLRVNGRRVTEAELMPGDELAVADTVFLFQNGSVAANEPVQAPVHALPLSTAHSAAVAGGDSGDVVLADVESALPEFSGKPVLSGPIANEGTGRDWPKERGVEVEVDRSHGLSADLLPTPRMLELSNREESSGMHRGPNATSDSQSGLRFVGA